MIYQKFALGLLILLLAVACDPNPRIPKADRSSVIPVLVTEPVVKDVPLYLESIGTVQAFKYYEVRPQVSGLLKDIYVKEGQMVDKGDLLLAIDPKAYDIKVQEAKAQLEMEKVTYAAAQKKLERMRSLAQKDLISQVEWESMQAQAAASLALIKIHEAKMASASLDLANCTLKAPSSGKVGKIDTHQGAVIVNSQANPLMTISQIHPLMVEFTLTEKEFSALQKDRLSVFIQPLCDSLAKEVEALITFIDNSFDPDSGRLVVRAEVQNNLDCLHPGQVVRVRLLTDVIKDKLLIPQRAVKYDSEGPYAYIVDDDNTAIFRQLKLGDEIDDDVIVIEGIAPYEKVITAGHLRLSPGLKVEIK